jgi:hypothetical protein
MGFFSDYRQRRLALMGPESVATIEAIERFFDGGRNWTRFAYHWWGKKCVVGALQSMQGGQPEDARYWIRQAIRQLYPGSSLPIMQIESFNDSHSYDEVAAVIARAKQLALAATWEVRQARAAPAAEILPPRRRPALTHQPERPVDVITLADMERVAVKRK